MCTAGCGVRTAIFFSRSISAAVFLICRSFQKIRPATSTEMLMSSGLVSRTSLVSFGNWTGIDVVTTGIVIRKMISSTSMTSTSGVVLIVETTSSSSPLSEPTLMLMALRLGAVVLRRGEQHGVQVGAEAADVLHRRLVAADEPVVAQHRGHRDGETDGGHDQRFADRTGDLVDRRLAGDADRRQRVVDAPHRAEQPDERGGGAHGAEEGQTVLQAALHVLG